MSDDNKFGTGTIENKGGGNKNVSNITWYCLTCGNKFTEPAYKKNVTCPKCGGNNFHMG